MLRFRNPGTQFSTQVQVLKQLYKNLGIKSPFSLKDMAVIIAKERLMTAYGYSGDVALSLCQTDNESMNSALMNAKMYAEVFRMLGWVTPAGDKSYPLVFTYIGIHIAESENDCSKLYEQCVLGINNPTELTDRMSYDENIRFFKCALRTCIDLGGIIYKHELCIGPMSVNDNIEIEYQSMIKNISKLRGNYQNLRNAFISLADSLGMKLDPVDNCTRLPIALLKTCGYVESVNDSSLYNKSLSCLKITKYGISAYNYVKTMKDLRLQEFNSYKKEIQLSLIRLGIYSMLKRAGYDLSSVEDIIKQDNITCADILKGKELLFSPYQTIKRNLIEEALGINIGNEVITEEKINTFSNNSNIEKASRINALDLNIPTYINEKNLNFEEDIKFLQEVEKLKSKGKSSPDIIDILFEKYKTATKDNFYPLISTIFKIIDFKCEYSRPGDNGARWDAIIIDDKRSIPIEIKSPTEEMHLSVKAIRQALENKIVLLSRKTHITDKATTSLAVGYCLPNDRAEVSNLVENIKETYGYKIGVLDFRSLLTIAISILIDNKGFDKNKLYELEGLANANI